MRQIIEKSFFEWSRDKTPRIQSRGIAALVQQQVRSTANAKGVSAGRCVWPAAMTKGETRYLSRRVWMS